MANPLTGDFEAILQVSGSTVNRLLATIHQNGGTGTTLPGFPHSAQLRIGDPDPIDGMRGTVVCQVAAPHLDLVHGATDRFWLNVSIRARYAPDPGTVPIPEFIHGMVRAQYRIDPIDPNCWGWQKLASEYLWIRVIADTVSFTGTAEDDEDRVAVMAPATADERVTRLIKVLLQTHFAATPHKVSHRFRPGLMRSLQVGVNRSVIAVPLGLGSGQPAGRVDSIDQDILSGTDFGIAVSKDFLLRRIQEQLDAVRASFATSIRFHHKTYIDLGWFGDIDVIEVTIDWNIRLTSAIAQWLGGFSAFPGFPVPGGLVAITLNGEARTSKAVFDWTFEVTQFLLLSFDAATEQFTAAPFGSAAVKVFGTFAAQIEPYASPQIQAQVSAQVGTAAAGLSAMLRLKERKDELVTQLRTIDGQAQAWLDNAVFTPDGVIVRGRIGLSPRRPPAQSFAMSPQKDGYSAFESWIPGGRIDSFAWSWTWFNNAGEPGSYTSTDRFVLRRPPGTGRGRFGLMMGLRRPLPGLDGMGRVCLTIHGAQMHPISGDMVPVSTTRRCTRFGFDIRLATPGRVFVQEWIPGPRDPLGPVTEVAIHEVGGPDARGHGANTLVILAAEWNREIASTLRDGVANSDRRDAGLAVLILLPAGTMARAGAVFMTQFQELAADLEAPLVVNEDVRGSWSKALGITPEADGRNGLAWRLLSPTGGVTWAHSGPVLSRELASALNDYLFPSPAPEPVPVLPGLSPGARIASLASKAGWITHLDELESRCPPPPLGRLGIGTILTFVTRHSAASDAALRQVAQDYERHGAEMLSVVIVDGANASDMEEVTRSLPDGVMALPDPDGRISRRLGNRVWPSNFSIDETGRVIGSEMGMHPGPAQPPLTEAV